MHQYTVQFDLTKDQIENIVLMAIGSKTDVQNRRDFLRDIRTRHDLDKIVGSYLRKNGLQHVNHPIDFQEPMDANQDYKEKVPDMTLEYWKTQVSNSLKSILS